jgi:hypothetical protein
MAQKSTHRGTKGASSRKARNYERAYRHGFATGRKTGVWHGALTATSLIACGFACGLALHILVASFPEAPLALLEVPPEETAIFEFLPDKEHLDIETIKQLNKRVWL